MKARLGLFDLFNTIYTSTESISDIFLKVELLTFEFSISWEPKIRYFVWHQADDDYDRFYWMHDAYLIFK